VGLSNANRVAAVVAAATMPEERVRMPNEVRLQLDAVTKRFGSSMVLDHVDLQVRAGQVHGMIGQNGAGKSTLVKTLAGLYPDHGGTVTIDGRHTTLHNPRQSRADGIAVIYQEFSLVPELSVAENLLLGREPGRWRYSHRQTVSRARQLVAKVGIEIGADVTDSVSELGPAVRQRIEIVKALTEDVRVLLLDEPTARLSEAERQSLFAVVRTLAARGVGMIFISHFLEEVRQVTDWLTVLRNGRVVGSAPTKSMSVGQMASLMLGRELEHTLDQEIRSSHADGSQPVVLQANHVSCGQRLRGADIALRAGEITAVAGLVGSGRTRLCRVLTGVDRPTGGHLTLRGRPLVLRSPRAAIRHGIAHIPEDRRHQGLCLDSPLTANLTLMALQAKLGHLGVVSRGAVRSLSTRLAADLHVSPPDIDATAGTLSGGNQQKVVLGKALAAEPEVLVIDQPTAGVDVGTKAQIHRLLRQRAEAGAAILVVSDDLDELYALGDRFHVMRQGTVIWSGAAADLSRERLVELVSGEDR
jgi:ABC-type sugar transport system ATPase subunit